MLNAFTEFVTYHGFQVRKATYGADIDPVADIPGRSDPDSLVSSIRIGIVRERTSTWLPMRLTRPRNSRPGIAGKVT